MGAQNIANGNASLEPDFSANTINTTWYSNGTQLTGNNIPATCTYDDALTPPTPADRPGYEFNGWKIKRCEIPSACVTPAIGSAAKSFSDVDTASGDVTVSTFGITQPGQWGVLWESGDKVTGVAFCSRTNFYSVGVDQTTGTSVSLDMTEASDAKYCWCKATSYKASDAQQCELLSSVWMYRTSYGSLAICQENCANTCGTITLTGGASSYLQGLFMGIVVQ